MKYPNSTNPVSSSIARKYWILSAEPLYITFIYRRTSVLHEAGQLSRLIAELWPGNPEVDGDIHNGWIRTVLATMLTEAFILYYRS